MSNESGLAPYIELSKTAKSYGGPKSYICTIRSSEYAAGLAEGLSERRAADFNSGLVTGCVITGTTALVVICGGWIYKKIKEKMEREDYVRWNRK